MKRLINHSLAVLFLASVAALGAQTADRPIEDLRAEADAKNKKFLELQKTADQLFDHLELPKAERRIDPCSKQILALIENLTQANNDQLTAKVAWLNKGKEAAKAEQRQAERILADYLADLETIQRDIESEKKQVENLEKSKKLVQENKTLSNREKQESIASLNELIELSRGRLSKVETRLERFKAGESQVRIVVDNAEIKVQYFEQREKALRNEVQRWITYYDSKMGAADYSCWQDRIVSLDQFKK